MGIQRNLDGYFNPFTAVYKCTQYAGRGGGWGGGGGVGYGYFDFIMVLRIVSYKIITTVGIFFITSTALGKAVKGLSTRSSFDRQ